MRLIATLQERLGWKLLISYLVVVLVGVLVLSVTAQFHSATAISRHVASMQSVLGYDPALAADLDENFHAAVNEILTVAALSSLAAAVIVSVFTAQRIVNPVVAMMEASQQIAAGDYHQRVRVPGQDELGTMAQAFNQMAETLEQTEQRRMELIGDVTHELRTPLSSIRGTMEGLVDGVLPAEPATFLSVQHEVARLQRLVQGLQELSRAESGQIPLVFRSVSVGDLAQAAADRLRSQYDDKGVRLRVDVPFGLPAVRADPDRIIQVLINLLGNALQYTPSGGQVTVSVGLKRQELAITIQDTGIGIPAEHLPHLFERFYRVDKSRSRAHGGSGIGLTIARHLVMAHGGRIWATSPGVGQGSAFTFTLPLAH